MCYITNDACRLTRPSVPCAPGPCVYFMTGRCLKGNACDFQHGVAPMAKTAEAARSIPTHADFPALPVEDGAESSFSTLGRWAAEGCTAKARAPTASLNKENRSRPYNYQSMRGPFERSNWCVVINESII